MRYFLRKIQSLSIPYVIRSGLSRFHFSSFCKLQSSVKSKNYHSFDDISRMVTHYCISKSLDAKFKFPTHHLWEMLDTSNALPLLEFLIQNNVVLMLIFPDVLDLIRIARSDSSITTLTLFLDETFRSKALSVLGATSIVRIASNHHSFSVFNILFDKNSFDDLIKKFDKEVVFKIASHSNANYMFNIFLDPQKWAVLRHHLDIKFLSKLAVVSHSKHAFDVFLVPSVWNKLSSRLSIHSIIKIASNLCCSHVFSIFLNDTHWKYLSNTFTESQLSRLSCHCNSNFLLDLVLRSEQWSKFVDRLGIEIAISMGSITGFKSVFQFITDDSKWPILKSRIDVDTIYKIVKKGSAKYVFDTFVDNLKWHTLLNRIGKDATINLACQFKSSKTLSFILDFRIFTTLKDRLTLDALKTLCMSTFAPHVFDFVLNKHLWSSIISESYRNEFINIILQSISIKPLYKCLLSNPPSLFLYFQLLPYLKKSPISHFHEKGLLADNCLYDLVHNFNLSFDKIHSLSRISGRHFPHILYLISSYPSDLRVLFSKPFLPLVRYSNFVDKPKIDVQTFKVPNDEKCCWLFTLCEYHRFFTSNNLSLLSLKSLKNFCPNSYDSFQKLLVLQNLFKFTAFFSQTNQLVLWNFLKSRSWNNVVSLQRLHSLAPAVCSWFISTGPEYIESMLTGENLSLTTFSSNRFDQMCLVSCLQDNNIRSFISLQYKSRLSLKFFDALKASSLTDRSSSISTLTGMRLLPVDWFAFTLFFYKFLDEHSLFNIASMPISDSSNRSFSLSDTDSSLVKCVYPSLFFCHGIITVNVNKIYLDRFLNALNFSQGGVSLSTPQSNTVKRKQSPVVVPNQTKIPKIVHQANPEGSALSSSSVSKSDLESSFIPDDMIWNSPISVDLSSINEFSFFQEKSVLSPFDVSLSYNFNFDDL